MFQRLTTSLANPRSVVFFMRDRFLMVIGYVLLLPVLLIFPSILEHAVDPSMNLDRYQLLHAEIENNFKLSNTRIQDGVLITSDVTSSGFEYYMIYLGEQALSPTTVNVVFEETELVLYMTSMEQNRRTYTSLGIENVDFNQLTPNDDYRISNAVKLVIEEVTILHVIDLAMIYLLGLIDILIIGLLLTMMMFIFPISIPLTFSHRYKISLYLMTIYVFSQLILSLFGLLDYVFLSILIVYIYHVIAYRFIRTLRVEVINEKR